MSKYLMTAAALTLALWVAPAWAQRDETNPQQQDQRDQTSQKSSAQRAYLGATIESSEDQQPGATVASVSPNSPAAQGGLKNGDIITKAGNKAIHGFEDLADMIHQHKPGDKLNLQVQRNGQEKSLTVTLREAPNRVGEGFGQQYGQNQQQQEFGQGRLGQRQGQMARGRTPAFLGVQTEEITPELQRERNLTATQGVVVMDVVPNSPAANAGLRNGDVITKFDGTEISTPDDLRRAIMQARAGQEVNMDVMRGNKHREFTAQLEQARGGFPMPGAQQRYGEFEQPAFGNQETIQRLQQRIDQLERRLRKLEQRQQNPQGDGTNR